MSEPSGARSSMLAQANWAAVITAPPLETSAVRRVSCPMATVHFEPPVGIYFGPPGQILLVGIAREAGACLLSGAWPDRHSEDFKRAMWYITAALEGRSDAKLARVAFKEASRAAGILVDQKLMMH